MCTLPETMVQLLTKVPQPQLHETMGIIQQTYNLQQLYMKMPKIFSTFSVPLQNGVSLHMMTTVHTKLPSDLSSTSWEQFASSHLWPATTSDNNPCCQLVLRTANPKYTSMYTVNENHRISDKAFHNTMWQRLDGHLIWKCIVVLCICLYLGICTLSNDTSSTAHSWHARVQVGQPYLNII